MVVSKDMKEYVDTIASRLWGIFKFRKDRYKIHKGIHNPRVLISKDKFGVYLEKKFQDGNDLKLAQFYIVWIKSNGGLSVRVDFNGKTQHFGYRYAEEQSMLKSLKSLSRDTLAISKDLEDGQWAFVHMIKPYQNVTLYKGDELLGYIRYRNGRVSRKLSPDNEYDVFNGGVVKWF